jgi:hypothetical protein
LSWHCHPKLQQNCMQVSSPANASTSVSDASNATAGIHQVIMSAYALAYGRFKKWLQNDIHVMVAWTPQWTLIAYSQLLHNPELVHIK